MALFTLISLVKIGVQAWDEMVCVFGMGLQRHNGAQLILH
jgi:hypothetical protein